MFLFRPQEQDGQNTVDIENVNNNVNSGGISTPITQLPGPSPERVEDDNSYPLGLKQLALSYAERFASYSTDANFKNLEDLKSLSTNNMIDFIDDFITSSDVNGDFFEATEAKALNSKLSYLTDSRATVDVSLQLVKFFGDKSSSTIDYGNMELECVKVGDEWRVDEANWK